MRRDVSLLMSQGHAEAAEYPICVLWHEVRLAVERVNGMVATQALLTQSAIASMFSKDAGRGFVDQIEKLTE